MWLSRTIFFLLFAFGVFTNFFPPVDPDFGWHYKYGEYFLTNHKLLTQNIFSYTMPDYIWHSSYWLFETILYFTHHNFGHVIAGIIFSLGIALYFLNYVKSKSTNLVGLILIYIPVIVYLADYRVSIRSFYFSSIFIVALVDILLYKPGKVRDFGQKSEISSSSRETGVFPLRIKFLPLLFLFWANLHADFLLGLFIFGLYACEKLFRRAQDIRPIMGAFLASITITLVNPYGIHLWSTLLKELTQPFVSFVAEWESMPTDNFALFAPSVILLFLAFGASIKYFLAERKVWYFVSCLFFWVFAIKSVYMIRVFALVSLPALIWFVNEFIKKLPGTLEEKLEKFARYLVAILFIFSAYGFARNIYLTSDVSRWSKKYGYPHDAVKMLEVLPYSGNIFNNYGWGGYMIWQLPKYKTFIDGRMAAWQTKDTVLRADYLKMTKFPTENAALVDAHFKKFGVRQVLDKPDSLLIEYLLKNGWRKTYADDDSVLIRK